MPPAGPRPRLQGAFNAGGMYFLAKARRQGNWQQPGNNPATPGNNKRHTFDERAERLGRRGAHFGQRVHQGGLH